MLQHNRRRKPLRILVSLGLGLSLLACSPKAQDAQVIYHEPGGKTVKASYHNPPEGPSSVSLVLPEGKSIRLGQGLAASGARYTDNTTWEWWTKGSSAMLSRLNAQGEWEVLGHYLEDGQTEP